MICVDLLKVARAESSINRVVDCRPRQIAIALAGAAEDFEQGRGGTAVIPPRRRCCRPRRGARRLVLPVAGDAAMAAPGRDPHGGELCQSSWPPRRELDAGLCCEATARAVLAELHRCSLPIIVEAGTCWSADAEAALLRDHGPCWVLFVDGCAGSRPWSLRRAPTLTGCEPTPCTGGAAGWAGAGRANAPAGCGMTRRSSSRSC